MKDLSDRVTELSTLMGVSALISSQLPLPEVLEQVCRLTAEICKAEVAFIHLSDGDDDLVCLARHAPSDSLRLVWEGAARLYGRRAVARRKMASRSSLLLRTQGEAPGDGARGMGGICSVPMIGRSSVVGALSIGYSGAHRFSAREKDILSAISAQLAMAVERSWLFDQLQEQLARANSLREVANRIGSNLRLDLLLDAIVDHASTLLAAEFSAIFLADSTGGSVSGPEGRGGSRNRPSESSVHLDDDLLGRAVKRAVETGRVVVTQHTQPGDRPNAEAEPQPGDYRVALAVPFLAGQEVLGALALCYLEERRFDESDIALAEDFAGQAALAIRNAHLYEDAMRDRLSLEAAIDQISNHGISLLDGDLNLRFANPATFWLLGLKPKKGAIPLKEWTGLVKKGLVKGGDLDLLMERMRECPEETIEVDLLARGRAASKKRVRLLSLPLRQPDGSVSGRVNLIEEE
jgi:GAF domain-containing protein